MGMTQEEIEALMNGTIDDANNKEEELKEDKGEDLSSKDSSDTDGIEEIEMEQEDDLSIKDQLDSVLEVDGEEELEESERIEKEAIEDEILDKEEVPQDVDSMLAGIEEMVADQSENTKQDLEKGKDEYSVPLAKKHKVLNELNKVTEDSETKASEVFDILSFILDYNTRLKDDMTKISQFVSSEKVLLERLAEKFPNVEIFSQNLQNSGEVDDILTDVSSSVETVNGKIFEAMELMQFQDIHRQKIERVMFVMKKLSNYLNNLFEDESGEKVQVAKHIAGDEETDIVSEHDLDDLIAEFNTTQ